MGWDEAGEGIKRREGAKARSDTDGRPAAILIGDVSSPLVPLPLLLPLFFAYKTVAVNIRSWELGREQRGRSGIFIHRDGAYCQRKMTYHAERKSPREGKLGREKCMPI